VRIFVDILPGHYNRIAVLAGRESRLFSVLMNGVIVYDRGTEPPRKLVKVLCEKSDAEMLLDAAKTLCPEATAQMEKSIALHREI
jgi:hypothetical protein